jgi:nucleoside-diphosphate-sugar epimerase
VVRVLDVLPRPPTLPESIEYIQADVRDRPRVDEAMEGIDVVHHHAAMVPLTKAGRAFLTVNVGGTQTVLDAARAAGVGFFIHVSTSAVYGVPAHCPITDATPLHPVDPYGWSKLEGERRVKAAARQGLPCAIVRPRTLIGIGRLGIFEILFEWIREGRRVWVIGDGRQLFQFLHVDDAVAFFLALAERRRAGVFNIGAARFGTLRETLEAVIRHAGTGARVVGTPAGPVIALLRALDLLLLSPLAPWHYRTYHKAFYFDIARAVREVGWEPRFGDVEALCASYDWYAKHRDELGTDGSRSTHRNPVRQGVLRLLRRVS